MYKSCAHKEIRNAIREAERAGFTWRQLSSHTAGWIVCTCGEHEKAFSTGKNPEMGARRIR